MTTGLPYLGQTALSPLSTPVWRAGRFSVSSEIPGTHLGRRKGGAAGTQGENVLMADLAHTPRSLQQAGAHNDSVGDALSKSGHLLLQYIFTRTF